MILYNKNLKLLKTHSKTLYDTLKNEKPMIEVSFLEDNKKFNEYRVSLGNVNCYINSKYDKKREALEIFRDVPKDTENLILLGFPSIEYADYIYSNFNNINNIIVVEPSLQILKKRLEDIDLHEMLSKLQVATFIINKTVEDSASIIIEMLQKNLSKKVSIVYNVSYKSLFKEYILSIEDILSQFVRTYITNTLTRENFKQLWILNTFKNLKRNEPFFINKKQKLFLNRTAVMVSGGPSLEKNIHHIKNIQDKYVIFAVGSAIKILDSNDISPHFRVAVDGNEGQVRIFNNLKDKSTPLIHSISSFYEIPENYENKTYKMVVKADFLTKYIYENSNIEYEEIDVGNSVANCTLDLISKLGFKKVILLGQDLCYSGGKMYAEGSWTNKKIEGSYENLIKEVNIYGEEVYTTIPFLNMKNSLEVKIFENKDIEYINATEGGLRIHGTIEKRFWDVIEDVQDSTNLEYILKKIDDSYNHNEYLQSLKKGLGTLEKEILDLIYNNDKNIELLKTMLELNQDKKIANIKLKEVELNQDKMYKSIFFEKVVIPYIGDLLKAIEDGMMSKYSMYDEYIIKTKILLNKSVELREYLYMIILLIEEYNGIRKLNFKYTY